MKQQDSYSWNMILSMADCYLILCLLSIITPGKFDTILMIIPPKFIGDTNELVIQMRCECFTLRKQVRAIYRNISRS